MLEASVSPHRSCAVAGRAAALLAGGFALAASAGAAGGEPVGADPIYSDGFESAECSAWSATSNPVAAPDSDGDDFGDESAPTAVCQLPVDFVFDATDCDDTDDTIHPGSTEVCNGLDDDCDGTVDDGLRDTNPGCMTFTNLGSLNGDVAGSPLLGSAYAEKWYGFTLAESSGATIDLRARISLEIPAGADFDLYVSCTSCGGALIGSSTSPGTTTEVVDLLVDDTIGANSQQFLVEVRYFAGNGCSPWTLTITGNAGSGTATCP